MKNEWTIKMPAGWMPGCCAICSIPCGRDEYRSVDCPLTSATKVEEPQKECPWCEGMGYRTVPDGEGHIEQEECQRCGGKGKSI